MGAVYRIRAGTAPGIAVDPADLTTPPGQPATFRVTASGAPPLRYQWQRNGIDIPGATGVAFTLADPQPADGGATFRVVVTNDSGSATSRSARLTVSNDRAPSPAITGPAAGALFTAGERFTYAGSAADAEDGPLLPSQLSWRVDYYTGGAPARPLVPDTGGVTSVSFTVPTVTPYTLPDVFFRVTLTATDSAGNRSVATRDLLPRTSTVTLGSRPAGVQLTLGGQPVTAPAAFTGVAGVERQLTAAATVTVNGLTLTFTGWSDGVAAAERTISTPAADATFQALYAAPTLLSVGAGGGRAVAVRFVDVARNQAVRDLDPAAAAPGFAGEARVATADLTGDGVPDTVVGSGPGGPPVVIVYDGLTGAVVTRATVFEETFTGGVFVAAADFDGDGRADLVVAPDEGGGPRVRVFRGADAGSVLADFFAIADPAFRGGARPAAGDLNGDGRADLVVSAGVGGGPRVAAYDGTSLATGSSAKLFGPGGGPRVRVLSGAGLLRNSQAALADFFAGDPAARGGVRVAVAREAVVAGSGPGVPARVTLYQAAGLTTVGTPAGTPLPGFEDDFAGGVYVG
jgi:hypothetical protein